MSHAPPPLAAAARLSLVLAAGLAIAVVLSGCALMSAFDMVYPAANGPPPTDRRAPARQAWPMEPDNGRAHAIGARRGAVDPEAEGWLHLERGRVYAAHRDFDEAMSRSPHEASPRIGMALALSLQGHHARAERTMREAMDIDPAAFMELSVSPGLAAALDGLVAVYVDVLFDCPEDDDARFMLATLHLIGGDARTARRALGAAPAGGWRRASSWRLAELLNGPGPDAMARQVIAPVSPAGRPPAEPSDELNPAEPAIPASPVADLGADAAGPTTASPDSIPSRPVDYDRLQRDLAGAAAALDRFSRKLIEKLQERQEEAAPRDDDDPSR